MSDRTRLEAQLVTATLREVLIEMPRNARTRELLRGLGLDLVANLSSLLGEDPEVKSVAAKFVEDFLMARKGDAEREFEESLAAADRVLTKLSSLLDTRRTKRIRKEVCELRSVMQDLGWVPDRVSYDLAKCITDADAEEDQQTYVAADPDIPPPTTNKLPF